MYNLSTKFSKPGDTVFIDGLCVTGSTVFASSDQSIASIDNSTHSISVYGIGETNISQDSMTPDCDNSGSILLTSTEDGKALFMSKSDYTEFNTYELIFVFFFLLVAFLINFSKNS